MAVRKLWMMAVVTLVGSLLVVLVDVEEATAELSTSTVTVDSGVVDIPIPTGAPVTTSGPVTPSPTLTVTESGRVADVDVGIRINHTFDNDLDITLTSPDGTTLDLSSDNGGSGDGYGTATDCTSTTGLTVFDDSALTSVTAGAAPFVGSFMPEAALAGFENETLAGTWTLGIVDDATLDFGQLVCWTLILTYAGPLAGADVCNQLAWDGDDATSKKIWVANADGTGRTEIITPGSGTDPTVNLSAVWSPDGSRIAWSGNDGTTQQIWVANADGTNRIEISSVGTGTDPAVNADPAWSPDGARIAWVGDDGTTRQIWAANADGTNRLLISTVAAGLDLTLNSSPAWSPDGSRIAWHGFDGTTGIQILVADADGTNRLLISAVAPGLDPAPNFSPAWSPDGSRIAWQGFDGTTPQIWVADADGTNRSLISTVAAGPDPTSNSSPAWSPDGSRIAWDGYDGTTIQIWVADPDGTNRVQISDVGAGPDPTFNGEQMWSPDGSRIAWDGSDGTTHQIWVTDPDGTGREEISSVELGPDPTSNFRPYWRSWNSHLGLTTTATGLKDGQVATATVTVTNAGPCPSRDIVITGLNLACVPAAMVSVSAGSLTGSTWTIPTLAGGASAIATLTGTVTGAGLCTSTVAATAIPAVGGQVLNATWGGTLVACPTTPPPFTDVLATSFARADIACIYGLNITTGTSPTTYSPADNVTREQMAAFLARLWRTLDQACPTGATPFTDIAATSFALADIACIYSLDITTGTSPTTYSPFDNVTREQMAAFLARLWRALGRICPTTGAPFTDVPPTSFALADIACIYGLDITTGTSLTTYSPADYVTREQMAAFLARLWRIA